jgi:hypothetical protein
MHEENEEKLKDIHWEIVEKKLKYCKKIKK